MDTSLIEKIKKEIEGFDASAVSVDEVGRVVRAGDGVAEVDGLKDAMLSEMVVFDDETNGDLEEALKKTDVLYGVVLNLEEESVRIIVLGDTARIHEGMAVRRLGSVLSVPVGESMVGRVVNALGEPIDGKGAIATDQKNPIEREAFGVIDRAPVNTPVHTGVKAIDAMIPIGRGQRELIIGDRHTGKTTLAIDTILSQRYEPEATRPICIYVAIGQKESKTARIVAELEEAGAMEYSIVVNAPASAPAALQFLAPYAGAAIGEYFMESGRDVVVVYDDLSKHAVAYRQLSLLLRRPPGREAYPGDIFYLHSRLLERSAKLSDEKGGGSITALPIIETQEGDVSAYIPTNVISITDGQIYLESDLFNKGTRPAINVGLSVSRVGSAAQTKAMKKVAGRIRLELAQFRELEAFMQFAQDLDEGTKKRIESGLRLSEILKQGRSEPVRIEEQVAVIFAGVNSFFADVPVDDVRRTAEKLIEYLKREGEEVLATIRESGDLSDEVQAQLVKHADSFKSAHKELFTGK